MSSLTGKRVLITGASSGIGAAAALAFAREGAAVALLARNREGLEKVAGSVREQGVRAHVATADVADPAALQAAIDDAATALGGLDVVVVNAAAMIVGRFLDIPAEDFDKTIDVTLRGAINTTRAAIPHLRADGGGTLVVTGSLASRVPLPGFASYATAKHGLRGFMNSLRAELRSARIPVRVAMVHPGTVNTPLWDHVSSDNDRLPRRPPDAYSPETVARAIVACAANGRTEFSVGGETRLMELGYALARPLADFGFVLLDRYTLSGRRPLRVPGLLRGATGRGAIRGSHAVSRPSLWALLRLRRP